MDGPAESQPIVIITGARQVGKTWIVRNLSDAGYFNWDTPEVKRAFLRDPYFFRTGEQVVVFDEIHKRRDWKKLLKGYFDSPSRKERFVVTGSGRLDLYQRGGDSLQGRYDSFKLWPVTYDEWRAPSHPQTAPARNWRTWTPDTGSSTDTDADLVRLGGFPKPLIDGSEARLRRWQEQYLTRLVREDTRDFSAVQRLDQMDLLARLLPDRVTSPISHKSLAEDIGASPVGIRGWLRLFEILHFGFMLRPFHRRIERAVKKEPKWYFEQWTYCPDTAARFENYLAVQLQAACSAWTEQGAGRWELAYLRDQDRREIDFVLIKDLKPMALVEAKSAPQDFTAALHHYGAKLGIPAFLVYPQGPTKRIESKGFCTSSSRFLKGLIFSGN